MAEDWRDYIVEQNIVMRPLKDLIPYDKNAKLHDNMVAYLRNNIKKIKFRNPIYIDEDMVIIEGHARRLAAMELGMEMVPTIMVTDLSPDEIRLMRLADNRLAELSDYDLDILGIELSELKADTGWDLAEFGLNFDFDDIPDMEEADDIEEESLEEAEEFVPDVDDDGFIEEGDVIHMGDHVLVCGDYTDKKARGRLPKGGCDIAIAFPPTLRDEQFSKHLMNECWEAFVWASTDDKAAYATFISSNLGYIKDFIYWHVSNPSPVQGDMIGGCIEPIVCISSDGSPRFRHKDGVFYGFIEASKGDRGIPMRVPQEIIEAFTEEGDTVLDPFAANGATLMACCDLGRRCIMMESSPVMCDIIVRRYMEHTGDAEVEVRRGNTAVRYPLPE